MRLVKQMKAKIIEELLSLWKNHRGACLGLSAGALIAIAMLVFGFWQTMFVVFMALAGLWLGNEYDSKADAWLDLKETMARFLPVRYQRFRGTNYTNYGFRKER